ncbi:DUF4276 family protein [Acidovorax sp. SUPP2825]|uniref:DUF4276 family protein n=1 Tax=Acidovorax sp. SUPP2825 TaxID=2920879 RepID=UPI0023DE2ED0|nr:DUF4276 family protein [Acidovorax sp. SUPP2825]GKS97689.1 DUF4276 family protein [Acidovorax sp. SUPP2825]
MTLHILVEGASESVFFDGWLKKLKSTQIIRVHAHQGKGTLPAENAKINAKLRGLLDQLPFKLKAFAETLSENSDGILILIDADNDDPKNLIENISKTVNHCAPLLRVEICVATEEMEAFYLGDLKAIRRAYPGADMEIARDYVPDSICGTWEKFGEIIGDDGGNKVAWAEKMGNVLTTKAAQSRSPSFKMMLAKISNLTPQLAPDRSKRKFYHRAKD